MAMNDWIRASDADRDRVSARLRDHFAEGRLTREELDERVSAALNAKTLGDLRGLMADLPESEPLRDPAWPLPQAGAGPVVLVRRGPRLLPLVMLLAFLSLLIPGSGLIVFAALQFFLVFALLAVAFAVVQAARFRRRLHQHWGHGSGYRTWGYPL
jgi:hypothetical protein